MAKGKASDHLLGRSWKGHNFVTIDDAPKKKKIAKKVTGKKPTKKVKYPPVKKKLTARKKKAN